MRYDRALFLAALTLAPAAAQADSSPPPPAVFSLPAPQRTAGVRGQHFLPLAEKQKFFPLPHRATNFVAYMPPHHETGIAPSTPSNASGITKDQAHQILSLFSRGR